MAYQLDVITEALRADPSSFVAECDENYARRIGSAADFVIENLAKSPIVLLSGPSGSGKTTTALKLEQALEARGVQAHTVSMDNYFLTLDRETASRTLEGEIDFESPSRVDMPLLHETFVRLARGETCIIPKFEFAKQARNDSRGVPLTLGKNEVAIFEGIHALSDDVAGRHPEAAALYVSARSNIMQGDALCFKGTWLRIVRRATRDFNFRGKALSDSLAMWHNVRRGEKQYISPFKGRANVIIDSSLRYEIALWANYAAPLREAAAAVARENPRFAELGELVDALEKIPALDPAIVPADSLLREFIGGGSYTY